MPCTTCWRWLPDLAMNITRGGYLALAWCCVALGTLGVFLPLLPTTVFLLIAAWGFAKSSDRWHRWLMEHRHFGPLLKTWYDHHAMPRRAKRIAFLTLGVSYAFTAYQFGPTSWAAILGGLCIAGVAIYIAHIPVLEQCRVPPNSTQS